jgi:phosphate-selective porin OprO and OprP
MKHRAATFAVAAAIGWGAGAQAVPVTTENTDLIINTKGGVEVKTVDKKFSFKLGGRIQNDQNIYDGGYNFMTPDPDNAGDTADNNFFRRVRIELTGTAYYDWNYELTPNFADGDGVNIEYAWLGFDTNRLLEFDSLTRVGRFKPYTGLEELTSSKWITAIERSTPTQFFTTGTRNQFASQGSFLDMFTVAGSYFRDAIGGEDDGSDLHGYAGRFTYSPFHNEDRTAHLGISYLDRETRFSGSSLSFRQQVRAADQLRIPLVGGSQRLDRSHVGFEGLGIWGPFSLQGEYFMGWLDPAVSQAGEDELDVDAFYILGRWTITGESLPYDFKKGTPGQIKPYGKWGAFELFFRYSDFNIEDSAEVQLSQYTGGINWYVNNLIKLALNYEHTEIDGDSAEALVGNEDSGDAIVTRAQFAF